MSLRKLALITVIAFAVPRAAHADVGIGPFFGEPTGLDIKLGLTNRTGLDLLFGWLEYHDFGHDGYAHVTYLVTPVVGHGQSVIVPLRLGIGVAVFNVGNRFADNIDVAARFPLEVGLRFRSAPLELYGEVALKLTFVDPLHLDLDGGIGLRFYF